MFRYLRLYLYFVRFSLSKSLEFRLDFTFRIVMDCMFYAVNIGLYWTLFQHFHQIGGWNRSEAMIFVMGFLFVDALQMTLISNNLWWIPQTVNRGDLDYYLVRPVSSLFFLAFKEFAFNSFINLLITVGLLAFAFHEFPHPLTITQIALYIALLLNGAFLLIGLQIALTTPIFWLQSIDGLRDISWTMSRVMERPDRIFQGFGRKIFTTVLPFCLMVSFPARLLIEGFSWETLAQILGTTVVFWAFVIWFWNRGLRSYSSASS